MLTEENRNKIAEKWECFRSAGSKKRKRMLDHIFEFSVEYDSGEEKAFCFKVDEKEVVVSLGYAGPRKDEFVKIVTNLRERDLRELGYLYEPGEADLLFSRRKDMIYIELPYMDEGFFLRYNYFVEKIIQGSLSPANA